MAIWELASLVHPIFYTRHLGLKLALAEQIVQEKNFPRQLPPALAEVVGPKYFPLLQALHEVLLQYADTHLTAKALYRFAPCYAEGDQIVLLDPHNQQKIFGKWELTRQIVAPHHCLSDWVRPQDFGPPPDNVACMVTTVGQNIRAAVQKLKEQGEFLKSHLLAAYALESAQAYAEFLHQKIRQLWQIAPTQGQRFSFGHASCPNLENQKLLFAYLQPAQIGVSLTEELMMDPEASVSAIVLHHPQAQYFDALKTE
jgi:5-methyltetrahydrofolate--homocysteine methyltransferase